MTDDTHESTTDTSPTEQPFESAVDDAVAVFEAAFDADESGYSAAMMGQIGSGVTHPEGGAGSDNGGTGENQ